MNWLTKQAQSFLNSKKSDPDLMEMLGELYKALEKRGYTQDDFHKELRRINKERSK